MKNIAVLLAGSGVFDGSELHEAVLSLYFIKKNGCNYTCFSVNKEQHHVVNHLTGEPSDERRNVLVESARIARGDVKNLSEYNPNNYDGLMIPGGFGVAKNLFTFAMDGEEATIDTNVQEAILKTHAAQKPIGAVCISPVLLAKAFQDSGVEISVTVGTNSGEAAAITAFGAVHHSVKASELYLDKENNIATAPAYICAKDIAEAALGIEKVVNYLCKK